MDDGEEWMENDEVPDVLRAKLQALKLFRNRSLAHGAAENALEIATPALKMFATLLEHNGSLNPEAEEKYAFSSQL